MLWLPYHVPLAVFHAQRIAISVQLFDSIKRPSEASHLISWRVRPCTPNVTSPVAPVYGTSPDKSWSPVFVPLKVPVAPSAIVIPLFCMILPVVESYRAIALSVELAGQWTSPVPSQTATSGLAGVPAPVTVTPSTDIWMIGLAGSVLSVFRPVTVSTEPPAPHVTHSVSKSLLLLFAKT